LSQVKERGGQIYAISSQTHEAAAQASKSWDVKYDVKADPKVQIAAILKEKGLLDIFINATCPPE